MTLPDSATFFEEVKREFHFLTDSGFALRKPEESSLLAKIEFVGKNAAVSLSLDRRDPCIDCCITRVIAGKLAQNDVAGGYWAPLHHYLIQHRKYRGGFREFKREVDRTDWQNSVHIYALALKSLAADVASDSAFFLEAMSKR